MSKEKILDLNDFAQATTVNPDEVLVIKTTKDYAQHIKTLLNDQLNSGEPIVVMIRKDMEAYVVKKGDLIVEGGK